MQSKSNELVLCSERSVLPPTWLPDEGQLLIEEPALIARLNLTDVHWLPRDQAEIDTNFKQWIPYILLRNPRGELAAYPRQGTEKRLHGLWSVGLGGHINPVDGSTWAAALWNGLRRELQEEFPSAAGGTTRLVGIINEEKTAVGRVHIGAVFLHETETLESSAATELDGMEWLAQDCVGNTEWPIEHFELWSRLALQLLLK